MGRFGYGIDASDTNTEVREAWLASARHNGARKLTETSVVVRSLCDVRTSSNNLVLIFSMFNNLDGCQSPRRIRDGSL